MVIPLVMRICATSTGEQKVRVLILVVHRLSRGIDSCEQRQLMQQYSKVIDWRRLELPSAEKRQQDSLKSHKFECSFEVWKDCTLPSLKKEVAIPGEELPPAEL